MRPPRGRSRGASVSLPFRDPADVLSLLGPEAAAGLGDLLRGHPERRRPARLRTSRKALRGSYPPGTGSFLALTPPLSSAFLGQSRGSGRTQTQRQDSDTGQGPSERESWSQGPRATSVVPSLKSQSEDGPPRMEPRGGREEWGWREELAFPSVCWGRPGGLPDVRHA